jgi:hypothetical protein
MVAQHPEPGQGAMVSRMPMRGENPRRLIAADAPSHADLISPLGSGESVLPHPLAFNIEIHAVDGELLLRLFERDGKLACEANQDRLEEGTKAFLYQMLQWSGQIPIKWKDEVQQAVEGQ